jgi:hypothetical protein
LVALLPRPDVVLHLFCHGCPFLLFHGMFLPAKLASEVAMAQDVVYQPFTFA